MLGEQSVGGHEPRAADSRFFNAQDIEAVALQEHIAATVQGAGEVPAMLKEVATEEVGEELRGASHRLEEILSGHIDPDCAGKLVVIGGLGRQLERIDEYRRPANDESVSVPIFEIPGSRITALQVNPGYYGNLGHIRPVVNLRIQTDRDWRKTHTVHRLPGSWNDLIIRERMSLVADGFWHQFAIGEGIVRLSQ